MTTEDIVRQDEQGYYYFVGRKSEVFKIDTKPVDLAKVENLSLESGLLDDALAIPAFTADNRAHIKILAIPKGTVEINSIHIELKEYLSKNLSPHEIPEYIELVEDLPRSSAGKKVRKPEFI